MTKYSLQSEIFTPIIESQRKEFFDSLNVPLKECVFTLDYTDKNYNCMPYLDAALESKIQGLSFQEEEDWISVHKWQV